MPSSDHSTKTDIIPRIPILHLTSVDLRVIAGPDNGKVVRLGPGASRIGTAPTCALVLTDPSVSRVHCEIMVDPEGVRVVDLRSTNTTLVNDVEVRDARLTSGAHLRLGGTTLVVQFAGEPLDVRLSTRDRFGDVLGASDEIRRVYSIMETIAPTDATVLIRGETGTGKELVARAIHAASDRAGKPFVAVDCGAIAENLIESELFGHVRGAFSGAVSDRRGLFENAHEGTLFLDEIGELPLSLQPKLLRVLESREVRRVGGNTSKRFDVRVLAATNRALAESVNDGTFRDDLYYRLAVVEIVLPPLRERKNDIAMIAQHFYELVTGGADPLPREVVDVLTARAWPGNIRELKNFVERSACLGWSSLWQPGEPAPAAATTLAPIVEGLIGSDLPLPEARTVWSEQFETLYLTALLRRTNGNVTRAAQMAGISRRSLHRRLAELRIRSASIREDEPEE